MERVEWLAEKVRARLATARKATLVTREQLRDVATATADEHKALIFTTLTLDARQLMLVFARQWFGSLRAAAAHALVIGHGAGTCRPLLDLAVPCYTDRLAPKLRGRQNQFGPQVLLKWWYALALVQDGFRIVFSDVDVAFLADPLAAWRAMSGGYDVQGLSDIYHPNQTFAEHHKITCNRGWMDNQYENTRRAIYPCQSTGLWFVEPTPPVAAFLAGLYGYLAENPNEWEQKAFQHILPRYLIGVGDESVPLRYRLLPVARFSNVEMYQARRGLRLPINGTVAVHCGYLKTFGDKLGALQHENMLQTNLRAHERLRASTLRVSERVDVPSTQLVLTFKNRSRAVLWV